jgi:hypothetical protein
MSTARPEVTGRGALQVTRQTLVVTAGGSDFFSKSGLANRYSVTPRTVDRWKNDPRLDFPKPDLIINGREYYRTGTMESWERKRATAAA